MVVAYEAGVSADHREQLTPHSDEVSALAFFPHDALPPFAFAIHLEIVREWMADHWAVTMLPPFMMASWVTKRTCIDTKHASCIIAERTAISLGIPAGMERLM